MEPETHLKEYLEEAKRSIDTALDEMENIRSAADEIDWATEQLLQAYAIARKICDI